MLWINNENIAIFISDKSDGNMFFEETSPELNGEVRANRIYFFDKHGIEPQRLVNLAGVHSANIVTFTHESMLGRGALDSATRAPETDGLIINLKNSYLMITGADCFPVFFYDKERRAVGAAHCGWRGILAGLPSRMITEFRKAFNSVVSNLHVWIGPGIKNCHFEVQQDVVELFQGKYPEIIYRDNRSFIDLPAIIKRQLAESGMEFVKITEHPDCTFCGKNWFSQRRDKTKKIQAAAFIIHLI